MLYRVRTLTVIINYKQTKKREKKICQLRTDNYPCKNQCVLSNLLHKLQCLITADPRMIPILCIIQNVSFIKKLSNVIDLS